MYLIWFSQKFHEIGILFGKSPPPSWRSSILPTMNSRRQIHPINHPSILPSQISLDLLIELNYDLTMNDDYLELIYCLRWFKQIYEKFDEKCHINPLSNIILKKIVAYWACTYLVVSSVSLWMKNWAKENVPVQKSLQNIHSVNAIANISTTFCGLPWRSFK